VSPSYIVIGYGQLAFAAVLILVNIGLSFALRLGLARSLTVATLRMVAQLLLVGFILEFVFALNAPLPVLGIGIVMGSLAGVAAVNRT
jgi:putative ABC transport system permease protein